MVNNSFRKQDEDEEPDDNFIEGFLTEPEPEEDYKAHERRRRIIRIIIIIIIAILLLIGAGLLVWRLVSGGNNGNSNGSDSAQTDLHKEVYLSENGKEVCEKIEDEDPKCSPVDFVVEVTYSTDKPTRDPVTATIVSDRKLKSISGWEDIGDNKYTKTFSAPTEEIILLTDESGQRGAALVSIKNIDHTPPKVVVLSNSQLTNQPVKVVLSADEDINDIAGWIRENPNTLSKEFSSNIETSVEVSDLAGNSSPTQIIVNNIDRSAPQLVSLNYSTTSPTNQDVTAAIVLDKSVTTPSGWTKISNTEYHRAFGANFSGTVQFSDSAGNVINVQVAISNIDKSPLSATVTRSPVFDQYSGNLVAVSITITFNKAITSPLSGWTNNNSDGRTFSHTFTENVASMGISGRDAYGNVANYALSLDAKFGEHSGNAINVSLSPK